MLICHLFKAGRRLISTCRRSALESLRGGKLADDTAQGYQIGENLCHCPPGATSVVGAWPRRLPMARVPPSMCQVRRDSCGATVEREVVEPFASGTHLVFNINRRTLLNSQTGGRTRSTIPLARSRSGPGTAGFDQRTRAVDPNQVWNLHVDGRDPADRAG